MESDLPLLYPIVLYLITVLAFVVGTLVIAHWIAPRRPTPVKEMPYESGMDPVGDARRHFDIKFYLIAILFLVFDVELLFLYPWAVGAYAGDAESNPLRGGLLQDAVFVTMLVFLSTLGVAYVYALLKGVFRWR